MKKKVFAALLSATMVMSMLTACGSTPEQQVNDSTEQSTVEPSSEESSAPVESSEESSVPEESSEEPAGGMAEAEPLPDPLYHFAMDGSDDPFSPAPSIETLLTD